MLLHTCGTHCPPDCKEGPRTLVRDQGKGGVKHFVVDMHCHVLTPEVERLVAERPQKKAEGEILLKAAGLASLEHNIRHMLPPAIAKMTSLAARLADMDAMGVDRQVISPSPNQYYYWADPDLADAIVRVQNEQIAAACQQHPERLSGMGNVAMQHADLSVQQLEYAMKELGLRGVEISSSVNGQELAAPQFAKFWAKAEELGAIVFLHPLGTTLGERLNQHYLSNTIGQPLETTIALSHLIFGGVLDRHPGLKIVAAHGGGFLPSYIGRSNHTYKVRPEARAAMHEPAHYLKQIWFDTVVYEPSILRNLIEQVGASQLVLGTDYPFDMGSYDIHGLIDAIPGITDAERGQILGGNALRLLG